MCPYFRDFVFLGNPLIYTQARAKSTRPYSRTFFIKIIKILSLCRPTFWSAASFFWLNSRGIFLRRGYWNGAEAKQQKWHYPDANDTIELWPTTSNPITNLSKNNINISMTIVPPFSSTRWPQPYAFIRSTSRNLRYPMLFVTPKTSYSGTRNGVSHEYGE